jgi:hypothetical protein
MCIFTAQRVRGIDPLSEAFSAIFEALRFELNFSNLLPGLKVLLTDGSAILRSFYCQVSVVLLRRWIHLLMNVWVTVSG